jgi:hypothetical protein
LAASGALFAVGYELKWDFDWIDRKNEFNALLSATAADLAARLERVGSVARFEPGIDLLTVNNRFAISLRLARSLAGLGTRTHLDDQSSPRAA